MMSRLSLQSGCLSIGLSAVILFSSAANAFGPLAGNQCPGISIPPSLLPFYKLGRCEIPDANPAGVSVWQTCLQMQGLLLLGLSCMINAERVTRGLPALPSADGLMNAATGHAQDAARLRWWVAGANPHINPQTGSTPDSRIKAAGYCGGNPRVTSEIAYTGFGDNFAAPMSAVDWWMNISTSGHREAILNPSITHLGIGFVGESADGTAPNNPQMGSYVINFGACQ